MSSFFIKSSHVHWHFHNLSIRIWFYNRHNLALIANPKRAKNEGWIEKLINQCGEITWFWRYMMSMICLKHFLHISLEGTRAFLWDSETWRTSLSLLEMVIPISFPEEFPWPDPSRPNNKRECAVINAVCFSSTVKGSRTGGQYFDQWKKFCFWQNHN